ncbi:solute carrier family 46 member 3 isoform X1 [Lingula anatina]|uniref:Solute carrier family 46 member 3 isoform X1 n=1 Tax=Lingula anatina TaxID=7574 RepID=A0A1S3I5H8_LINAN|nr:solute carrier family 46 member 3 isoform X1 [Lingula anatina]XP_023930959.1 solute carrier family 46 member 3 isoform X1 [Lingula anatina]XP_023930960.1 solute carrier family 46 member 3 isoform X1 [Lingula anatina]XP_023930961.1 solute carrier family 46 member 3 isoform X1 [Lingula anatina]|eukprot:XP_023930958.1 solute carrier family 46 member 3 isoform X1 [Lingula anatina]
MENAAISGEDKPEGNEMKENSARLFIAISGVLFLYVISSSAYSPLTDQYVYSALARQYGLPCGDNDTQHSCQKSQSQCMKDNTSDPLYDLREKVEGESSSWVLYITVPKAIITVPLSLLYGSYSDRGGRKIPILMPCIGLLINYVIVGVVIFFQLDLYFIAIACAVEALFGSIATNYLGIFAYTADISSIKVLTFRIAVLEGLIGVTYSLTQLGLGYLIETTGFMYPILIAAGLQLINIIYVCLLKETIQRSEDAKFLSCENFQKIFRLFVVDNGSHRLWKIRLLMLCTFIIGLPCIAVYDVQTLFQLNAPLCWTSVKIGFFLAGRFTASLLAQMILTKIFNRWFDDDLLAVVVIVMGIASWVFEAFATTDLLMYLVIVVGLSFDPFTFLRAMASKLGHKDEQGALFSTVAAVESLAYGAGQATFTNIYTATLSLFQGMVFLVMAGFYVIAMVPFLFYIIKIRKENKYKLLVNTPTAPSDDILNASKEGHVINE